MRYILPILTLLALLVSCAKAPSHNQPITYDHPTPKQLGKLDGDIQGLRASDGAWENKWFFFENYLIVLSFERDSLMEVEIDHRVGNNVQFEVTDCCFDLINIGEGERPDTCWWWQQLPNKVRDEISSRKISTY